MDDCVVNTCIFLQEELVAQEYHMLICEIVSGEGECPRVFHGAEEPAVCGDEADYLIWHFCQCLADISFHLSGSDQFAAKHSIYFLWVFHEKILPRPVRSLSRNQDVIAIIVYMILIIRKKATFDEIKKMAMDYDGYIKLVIDTKLNILAGGGEKHFDAEQLLLQDGSQQENLWGGGIDWETKEIDYNSVINLRPRQNKSRDILSEQIRKDFDTIIKELLLG